MKLLDYSTIVSRIAVAAALFAVIVATSSTSFADGPWSGSFQGASSHVTSGSVTVTESGGTITISLGSNFSLDGAPDPYVGFGTNGSYQTEVAVLAKHTGAQQYTISASSVDLNSVNEVYIWCKRFSVPLGVASIQ